MGATLRAAAKACGIGWRTVTRWNVERPGFREVYEDARRMRTLVWAEQCLDIADDSSRDHVKNLKTGELEFNRKSVHKARLRIQQRQWQMSRRHPVEWGDRQQIDVKSDFSQMSEEERVKRALELIGVIREITGPRPKPPALRYDPGTEEAEPEPSGIG
jgi:hypothetical protein